MSVNSVIFVVNAQVFYTIMCKQNGNTSQFMLPLVTSIINMPPTEDCSRLLPSIVRINSESDIDEVSNEEVTRLPAIVDNHNDSREDVLKEKWWIRQRNRFGIRTTKLKQKHWWHKKVSFHKQLPPLQGVCCVCCIKVFCSLIYMYNTPQEKAFFKVIVMMEM